MPKARPPFDMERYTSLKAQGLSQRQIAREMGMPDATLRNNLKVYQRHTSGVPAPTSTEPYQGTPGASTRVHPEPPPESMQGHQGTPAWMSTEVAPGGLPADMLHDLQQLVAWWRQRSASQGTPGPLVRHTFHVEARWLKAIRREAERTGESYAAVLNRALAAYFGGEGG